MSSIDAVLSSMVGSAPSAASRFCAAAVPAAGTVVASASVSAATSLVVMVLDSLVVIAASGVVVAFLIPGLLMVPSPPGPRLLSEARSLVSTNRRSR